MGGPGEMAPQGGFVVSLDFELMWGVRDKRTIADYGPNILGGRAAVPRLLDLFARHGIGCTWATVGLLFFEDREALRAALPAERPGYADPGLSPYDALEYALFYGRRLPSEEEWEVAASWDPQNAVPMVYPWGDREPSDDQRAERRGPSQIHHPSWMERSGPNCKRGEEHTRRGSNPQPPDSKSGALSN